MRLNRRDMLVNSAFLATGILVGCGKLPESALRIGAAMWPGYEPLFLARELNYLDEQIQIVEFPGTPEVHRSFQNHALEAACVTLDEALRIAQFQEDVRIIMAIDFSNGADALLCKPNVTSLADLRGKRIGVELNALGSFILCRVLEKADLKLTDVTIVSLSSAGTEARFQNGNLDAVIAYEPVCSRLRDSGAAVLFDSSQMPGEIMDVLIVRAETLASHPDSLLHLLNGWFRAVEFCKSRPAEAARHASSHRGITEPQFGAIFGRIELLGLSRNLNLFDSAGGALQDTIRKLGASMRKYQLLEKMVDPATLLDAGILNKATT